MSLQLLSSVTISETWYVEAIPKPSEFKGKVCIGLFIISEGELSIMNKGKFGDIYHLSTNKLISINRLVRKICKVTGKKFEENIKIT